jgi:hypothetical protein
MDAQEFETIFEAQVDACRKTLVKKAEEYLPVDRLSNFKVAGTLAGCTPQQALGGMLAKHVVSIYDLIRDDSYDLDIWNEKLGDALNYLFLLKALLIEQNNPPITKQGVFRPDETVTFLKKINTEANYTYPNKK